MAYSVFLDRRVEKELAALPGIMQKRVASHISKLSLFDSYSTNAKKLKIPLTGYRLRVGDYRVLFDVEGDRLTIYAIRHRSVAYKKEF